MLSNDWTYDIETFPNAFTLTICHAFLNLNFVFEISRRKDNREELFKFIAFLQDNKHRMVGFNNLAFDYPVLHFLLMNPDATVKEIYDEAQRIINSMKDDRFGKTIPSSEIIVPQVDLYKIHHFDNQAKRTSLKILKFNMRLPDLQDMPFEIGTNLIDSQIDILIKYNIDDTLATKTFYLQSIGALELRDKMGSKYNVDFTNFNDSKIGSEVFISELEKKKKGTCYHYIEGKKIPKKTKRKSIDFSDILLPYIQFKRPEFQAVKNWLEKQVIAETKGIFKDIPEHRLGELAKYTTLVIKKSKKMDYEPSEKEIKAFLNEYPMGWLDNRTPEQQYSKKTGKALKEPKPNYYFCWREAPKLSVVINGHEYIFGTGGIHSSIDPQIVRSDKEKLIVDLDVESYYPNLAIKNNIYPEHLSSNFCIIYNNLFEERKKIPKSDPSNLAIKLALNGTYGNSNNEYSVFYDSKYTMKITLNGQMSLCMLIERILELDGATSVQSNTDGITMAIKPEDSDKLNEIVAEWENETKLKMERNDYSEMRVRDVNNYSAKYISTGKTKLKGAYVYDLEQHKNHSQLVVKKAVANFIETGEPIEEYIKNHKDMFDFMLRTKIPKQYRLILSRDGEELEQQHVTRFYVSLSDKAGELIKIMPPLEGKEEDRRNGICVGKKVKICNNIVDFDWDIDYDYYIEQANKLLDVFGSEDEE